MKYGKVDTFYLEQLPEELRKDYEPIVTALEGQYKNVILDFIQDWESLPLTTSEVENVTPEARKKLGLFLKGPNTVKHKSAMFSLLLDKKDETDKYVMKYIRPDGNNMKSLDE